MKCEDTDRHRCAHRVASASHRNGRVPHRSRHRWNSRATFPSPSGSLYLLRSMELHRPTGERRTPARRRAGVCVCRPRIRKDLRSGKVSGGSAETVARDRSRSRSADLRRRVSESLHPRRPAGHEIGQVGLMNSQSDWEVTGRRRDRRPVSQAGSDRGRSRSRAPARQERPIAMRTHRRRLRTRWRPDHPLRASSPFQARTLRE